MERAAHSCVAGPMQVREILELAAQKQRRLYCGWSQPSE